MGRRLRDFKASSGGHARREDALRPCDGKSTPKHMRLGLLLIGLVSVSPALLNRAEANAIATIEEVRVGIDGAYKLGQWTPVQARIRTGAEAFRGRLIVQAADPNGVAAQHVGTEFDIRAEAVESVTTYVKFGQVASDLRVIVASSDGRSASRRVSAEQLPPALTTGQQLVMTLGNELSIAQRQNNAQRHGFGASRGSARHDPQRFAAALAWILQPGRPLDNHQ